MDMNQAQPKEVSIIIVSYNTRDFLKKCLHSLRDISSDLLAEIIVVDNCSSDGSVEMVENEFPEAELVRNQSNLGYAKAVNQGMRRSRGRYFLILNPDIEAGADAIRSLWEFMEANPEAGISGAKLLYPDGALQMSCRTFYTLPIVVMRRTFLGKIFPNSRVVRDHLMLDWGHDSERHVDWVIGACMMVRRDAYEGVGGMDERFFLYLEDVDWCYRMKQHGWKVYYVPSGVMKHDYRRESARLLPDRKLIAHLLSTFRFYDKWNSAIYALKKERRVFSLIGTIVLDLALINVGFILAFYFRLALQDIFTKPVYPIITYRSFIIFVNIVCIVSFFYSGLYRKRRPRRLVRDLIEISRALLLSSLVIMAATYLTRTVAYSRLVVLVFWPISAVLVTAGRTVQRALHRRLRQSLFDLRRVAVVGEDQDAVRLRETLSGTDDGEYDFVGYVAPAGRGIRDDMKPLMGDTDHIGDIVFEHRINEVIVCDRQLSRSDIGKLVVAARRFGAEVKVVSEVTDMLIRGSLLEDIGGVPVVVFPAATLSGARLITKYISDFLFSVLGIVVLVVLAPVVVVSQTLTYRNYSPWLRATGQLLSVIAGRRSLVGPLHSIGGERIRPGVTGVWLTTSDAGGGAQGDRMDVYYIQNWSLSFDIEIVLMSLKRLVNLFKNRAKHGNISEEGGA
jgi:GT2 family glycosyltransferase